MEGIVIGIIVALILKFFNWTGKTRRQREQIRYAKNVITKFEGLIHAANDLRETEACKAVVRYGLWVTLCRDLTLLLEGRAGELSYPQKAELRLFLAKQEALGSRYSPNNVPPEKTFYEEKVFKGLYAIRWLKPKN